MATATHQGPTSSDVEDHGFLLSKVTDSLWLGGIFSGGSQYNINEDELVSGRDVGLHHDLEKGRTVLNGSRQYI